MSYLRNLIWTAALLGTTAGCQGAVDGDASAATAESQLREKTPTITFTRSFEEFTSSPLERGQIARVAYDVARLGDCRGEQNGIPQWSIGGFYSLGGGPVQAFSIGGLNADGSAPSIPLERAGDLQLWFENGNRWGCHAYDSNFGQNYHFQVAPAAGDPGWIGNVRYAIDRQTCEGGPCDSSLRPLGEEPVVYETYARQRAAIRVVEFDVWKEGVTDFDNPDLWRSLDVQLHFKVQGTSEYGMRHVNFLRRVGNDARYRIDLRDLDSLAMPGTITDPAKCPDYPIRTVPQSGEVYAEAPVTFFVTVNGVEARPAPGKDFQVRYQNYASLVTPCLDR